MPAIRAPPTTIGAISAEDDQWVTHGEDVGRRMNYECQKQVTITALVWGSRVRGGKRDAVVLLRRFEV